MTLQLQVRQVLGDLGFRFDENQPRDPNGKWSGGAPDVDLPDVDLEDDDEDSEPEDEDYFNNAERFPASYTAKYGNVVEEIALGHEDLFLAKTDKGAFHVARGEADRTVLADLTDESAGSLADMADLFVQAKPPANMWIKVPGTGINLHPADDGGIRLDWPDGTSTHFTPDDVDTLSDALLAIGPGYD